MIEPRGAPSLGSGEGIAKVDVPTAADGGATTSDSDRIRDGVEALLHQRPDGRRDTLWAGECAPGRGVSHVRITDALVTVTLEGAARRCATDQAMTWLQAQQLAWTVVENSDVPQDVAIRFVDGSGETSERFAADPETLVRG